MNRAEKHTKLLLVSGLALLLFNAPLLFIWNNGQTIGKVPILYVYLFASWLLIIVLTAWLANRRVKKLP